MSDQPTNYEVPPTIIIDTLRNEIARLNDERLSLVSQLSFANTIVAALQYQLEHPADVPHTHDDIPTELAASEVDDTSVE